MIAAVCSMPAGSDLEIYVGLRDLQLLEEDGVHRDVEMLAGVQQTRGEAAVRRERAQDRGDLHEIGTRADDAIHSPIRAEHSSSQRRV